MTAVVTPSPAPDGAGPGELRPDTTAGGGSRDMERSSESLTVKAGRSSVGGAVDPVWKERGGAERGENC